MNETEKPVNEMTPEEKEAKKQELMKEFGIDPNNLGVKLDTPLNFWNKTLETSRKEKLNGERAALVHSWIIAGAEKEIEKAEKEEKE